MNRSCDSMECHEENMIVKADLFGKQSDEQEYFAFRP
jgi:hypothetical protein